MAVAYWLKFQLLWDYMASPDSVFFLPAFNIDFPAYFYSALSTGQGSPFINEWYSQHTEGNPSSLQQVLLSGSDLELPST